MGPHKFGVYENWVTSDTQKNKVRATLCALNMCVFSVLVILFRHLAFFSCFPSSWTYLSFPWELSLFSRCTRHHLSCLFISALITLFHSILVSFFFLYVKAAACWVIQYISLLPDPQSIFQYFLQKTEYETIKSQCINSRTSQMSSTFPRAVATAINEVTHI